MTSLNRLINMKKHIDIHNFTGRGKTRLVDSMRKTINRMITQVYFGRNVTGPICIWKGESLFDGKEIQIIIQCYVNDSENKKTGPMIQVSILPVNKTPYQNFIDKEKTVCNECIYNGSGCYVQWVRFNAAFKAALKNIGNLILGKALFTGNRIRVGTVGDPAAVPFEVWEDLLTATSGFTGYTHSWETCDQRLRGYFMASCDTLEQVNKALLMGWKPFHVYDGNEAIHPESIECLYRETDKTPLAQFDNTFKIQCFNCLLCNGYNGKNKPITSPLHGATSTISAARKARGAV